MGMSNEKLTIDPLSLFLNRHQIIGSQQNSPEYLYEALDFLAKGKVKVMSETFSLDNIGEAYDKVEKWKSSFSCSNSKLNNNFLKFNDFCPKNYD